MCAEQAKNVEFTSSITFETPFWQVGQTFRSLLRWYSFLTFQPYIFLRIDNGTRVKNADLSMLHRSGMSVVRVRLGSGSGFPEMSLTLQTRTKFP